MIDTVIFDLDGTLLNTLDDLADSVNFVLVKSGYPARTREEVRSFVGNGVKQLIKLAMPDNASESELSEAISEYREYYAGHCRIKTGPYDGIIVLLKTLKKRRIKMAIVSNKSDAAVKELSKHYFAGYIDAAIGQQDGIDRKPSPDMVVEALKMLGSDKQSAIYVGDSEVDKMTADNAGIDCVLVSWGFRERNYLKGLNAADLISDPAEILKYIL